ncbi:hypothetical protein MXB_4811, partial [Myxobolus squamalis]
MHIPSVEVFKNWLTKTLEPLCDADPSALAKYIVALLHKNKTNYALKSICTEQLEVFLSKETEAFIDNMFQTLESRSYMNSNSETDDVINAEIIQEEEQSNPDDIQNSKEIAPETEKDEEMSREASTTPVHDLPEKKILKYSHKPCFEFQAKGTCSRRSQCPYQHIQRQAQTDLTGLRLGNLPLIPTGEIIKNIMQNEVFNQMLAQNKRVYDFSNSQNEHRNENLKRKHPNLYSFQKTGHLSKSLILKKVPPMSVNINDVNLYFSKFGKVINVILNFENNPSWVLIEFSTSDEAKAAYDSPDAIFGNRFIRIFYYKSSHKSEEEPKAKIQASTQLTYVNPDYLAKEEATKKENSVKQIEFDEKKQVLLSKIEKEVKNILCQLKLPFLDELQKEKYRNSLKELMADKDRLSQHSLNSQPPKFFKFNKEQPNFLDKRPSVLHVQMNKFSNPTDILNHFSVLT